MVRFKSPEDAENALLAEVSNYCKFHPPLRSTCIAVRRLLFILTSYSCPRLRAPDGASALLCPGVLPFPAVPVHVLIYADRGSYQPPPGLYLVETTGMSITYCPPSRRFTIPPNARFWLLSPLHPRHTGLVEHALQNMGIPSCKTLVTRSVSTARDAQMQPALASTTILLGERLAGDTVTYAVLQNGRLYGLERVETILNAPYISAVILFLRLKSNTYASSTITLAEYDDECNLLYPLMAVRLASRARTVSLNNLKSLVGKNRRDTTPSP